MHSKNVLVTFASQWLPAALFLH